MKAERAWKQSETDAAQAMGEELAARTDVVRQMQKNEGALLHLFPGKHARVRSYFRPTRHASLHSSGAAHDPAPE
jgi:hypothetical protein